jgi:hypothetical protein
MRVSSSAPAMSRRSILRGLACALAGALVPVAAIAGITASRLTAGQDAVAPNRCLRGRKLKRFERRTYMVARALPAPEGDAHA